MRLLRLDHPLRRRVGVREQPGRCAPQREHSRADATDGARAEAHTKNNESKRSRLLTAPLERTPRALPYGLIRHQQLRFRDVDRASEIIGL